VRFPGELQVLLAGVSDHHRHHRRQHHPALLLLLPHPLRGGIYVFIFIFYNYKTNNTIL